MYKKRKVIFGAYDTALHGRWTLASLKLTDPNYQAKFVDVIGRDGPLDVSTVLTDGEPRYGSRTLTALLENSDGTREDRRDRIGEMVNTLDGMRVDIIHPDYPGHYLTGRVQVKEEYNDLAHCAVTVTAICDPWLQRREARDVILTATSTKQLAGLPNTGRRTVAPEVTVTGTGASFLIECEALGLSLALSPGTYKLPDLLLRPGNTLIKYSGSGQAVISYREAVLR
jgi:hypothetical protein